MYWHKTPTYVQLLYPQLTWHKLRKIKTLYVTFDDGPVPKITPKVLDILDEYDVKATFFCVGHNVEKYPDIHKEILNRGHKTGNHTHNHLNGWKTAINRYLENVERCALHMPEAKLFRPAYGKLRRKTIRSISKKYEIIMWDVLSGDFDHKISKEKCLSNTIRATQNGSIIIFHDSLKAKENMLYVLPRFLAHFSDLGYNFKAL